MKSERWLEGRVTPTPLLMSEPGDRVEAPVDLCSHPTIRSSGTTTVDSAVGRE